MCMCGGHSLHTQQGTSGLNPSICTFGLMRDCYKSNNLSQTTKHRDGAAKHWILQVSKPVLLMHTRGILHILFAGWGDTLEII